MPKLTHLLCAIPPRNLTDTGCTINQKLLKRDGAKIDTEQGRKIYPRRTAIVDPVFANICTHKGLNRFTLRGKIKVTIQWLLYCIVHNIEKIAHFGYGYATG